MSKADVEPQFRVLILEDQVADAELCERELRQAGLNFVSRRVDTVEQLEAELEHFHPDVILSDFTFPGGFDGLLALEAVRRVLPDVPFIFVSGTIGEERAVEAMKKGAADYVLKDRMGRLGSAVRRALELAQIRREKELAERALRESEGKYGELIEQASDGIFVTDHDGNFLLANSRYREMLGYTEHELSRLHMSETYLPSERANLKERLAQLETIKTRIFERMMLRRDGSSFPVEISMRYLANGTHQGIVRDITERRLQEQKIEKLSRVRAVSSEINSAIVRSPNRRALYYEACRIAIEFGNFGIAWIGSYDPEKMEVAPVASAGLEGNSILSSTKLVIREDTPQRESVLAVAIRERRPVYNNDIVANANVGGKRREEAIRRGYRSVIAMPLMVEGTVVASFSLFTKERDFFDQEEVDLLAELARNISFALGNMGRQEKLDKLSRIRAVSSEINATIVRIGDRGALLQETCRIAAEHGGFGMVWIGEIDRAAQKVRPAAWVGFSSEAAHGVSWASIATARGTMGEAIETRKAAVRNDIGSEIPVGKLRQEAVAAGYLSTVCLPLVVDGDVVALITMFAAGRDFFDESELALLNEVAADVSFALQSIAQREKVEKLSRIRALSGEINAAIVRAGGRQALLAEAARIAAERGGFPLVWIGLLDAAAQELKPTTAAGALREHAETLTPSVLGDVPSGQGTNGRAFRDKVPVVDNDLLANPGVGHRRHWQSHGICAALSLPLLVEGASVGVMGLYSREKGHFDEEEVALLGELASNVSFALESIGRQERIERMSRIRSVLGEINAAIVHIRDKQNLFDEACRIAVEAGRFEFAWIGTVDRDAMLIRPVARAGDASSFGASMRASRPLHEDIRVRGPSAEAVLERRPVIVNDVQGDPRISRKQDHRQRGINSIAVLPLLVEGEAVGVLGLYAKETGFFDEEELRLLNALAGDIALALQGIAKQEEVDYLSFYDALTGLPNRTLFLDRTGQQMRARGGESLMVALVLINIERFRNINEAFGRRAGDELLTLVAQRLEKAFRGKDYIARIGADGFGVVVRGIRDATALVHIAEDQVLGCFREPYALEGRELRVGAKAGVAMYPADGQDADTLFRNAEAALKKARDSGERYLFYAADMNARAAQVLSLETRLRVAVEQRQFVLHYQPKMSLGAGKEKLCGLEALIRWQEPGAGLVAPGTFIPLLEETGLILEVGEWALERALADHREWTARGLSVPRIAVNVSPIQLQHREFAELVTGAVHQEGDHPEALELEVTESLLMKDVESSIRKLSVLRSVGIHIAMDDFGTGYSSLSYLARLPINSLKIDRSFIQGMAGSPQDMAIVTTIIALAHSLNLRVVAEGVETREQARLLALLKCDEAQGFLYSKPLPAVEIESLLRAQPAAAAT